MPYIPRKQALASIRENFTVAKGKRYTVYRAYLGTDPMTGAPIRISSSDEKRLKAEIDKRYKALSESGEVGASLDARQALDAFQAFEALKRHGLSVSLLDCVNAYAESVRDDPSKPVPCAIGKAYNEYLSEFTDESDNRKTIVSRVGNWVNAYGSDRQVSSVTEEEVTGYIGGKYNNPKTYNNHLTYIRTFLNWCMQKKRRYLVENPLDEAKVKAIQWKRPEYMNSADTEKLMRALEKDKEHPERLAYAIVSFFCGVRREEILRGSEDEDAIIFDIPNATLTVVKVKRFTQGAHPRSFTIPDNAFAWMRSFDFQSAWRGIYDHVTDRIGDVADSIGVKLTKNAGRHSFITHHIAAYDNIPLTCKMAGTSEQMIKNNYGGLGNKPDGERYFAIMPSVTGA